MRLLLAPDEARGTGELSGDGCNHFRVERVQLLGANDRSVFDAMLLPVGAEIVIDFSRAEDQTLYRADVIEVLQVREDFLKAGAFEEIGFGRNRLGPAKEALRRHQDQRLAEIAVFLAAQGVEILRRGREVSNDEIVLRAELQEALKPRARVLRPHAFVSVRQQHHQIARGLPF